MCLIRTETADNRAWAQVFCATVKHEGVNMNLNELAPQKGSTHARKRLGRGVGSGTGKTSGKGHKGQNARSGVRLDGFEGGQMPLYRRVPKRGFTPLTRNRFQTVNMDRLEVAIEAGRLDGSKKITPELLEAAGLVRSAEAPVKLLGSGGLKAKRSFEVHAASSGAKALVEKAGGTIELIERSRSVSKDAKGAKAGDTVKDA